MSEWWTYTLSDFIMFSPRTYARLLMQVNRDAWPAQPVLLAFGVAGLSAAWRRPAFGPALFTAALAGAWACTGADFLARRYAQIFTGAPWAAWAFGVQALLLGGMAWQLAGRQVRLRRWPGLAAAAAWAFYPLLAPVTGRTWPEAEIAVLFPDPTAIVTLFWLAALPMSRPHAAACALVPLLWCGLSSATLHLLQVPLAAVPIVAAGAACLSIARR